MALRSRNKFASQLLRGRDDARLTVNTNSPQLNPHLDARVSRVTALIRIHWDRAKS